MFGWKPKYVWFESCQKIHSVTRLIISIKKEKNGLPVRLPYIVITCARMDSIKRVCSEPPCCPGAFLDLLSIHDNFGDENGILGLFYSGKSERNS